MKTQSFDESRFCFALELEAETSEEVTRMARLGMNKTKDVTIHAYFSESGKTSLLISVGRKRVNPKSYL